MCSVLSCVRETVALGSINPGIVLKDGTIFGLPVVLDTTREDIVVGDKILLTYQGQNIAVFTVGSKWIPDKPLECLKCYGTSKLEHPAVQMVAMERGHYYMGTISLLKENEELQLLKS